MGLRPTKKDEGARDWCRGIISLDCAFNRAGRSGSSVTVNGLENRHGDVLRDGSELGRDISVEVDFLHKPMLATTCSNGMPWPPLRKYSSEARRARRSSSVNSSSSSSSTMTSSSERTAPILAGGS